MAYLKRIIRYYGLEIVLAVLMLYITLSFSMISQELASALARKVFLWSAGLVAYYVARLLKVGVVEWDENDKKLYSIVILLYTGLVFAFG
ncbi:MAG: hypothetical protein KNN13_09805 [Hydrogenobacter thermophilus]|uniref:hypothetical protein n=1 Tax=Hydrogenobacter thermophilus TaxID=940 RepID=UPI001C746748|nr:hypothetical protein [Hydrogenobacter thermophilus]QWK19749.1 MAG: hypothetical protein KNN13_09805 [Hydrogenobacter thermophilus]